MACRKKYTIEKKYTIVKLCANQNNIFKASKNLGFIFYLVYKTMELSDVSKVKSYLAYKSMDLSDV